jgi:hypothetical protein
VPAVALKVTIILFAHYCGIKNLGRKACDEGDWVAYGNGRA